MIADAARLGCAPRSVGLRIEIEHDGAAAEVGQRDVVALLVGQCEVGSGGSSFDHALQDGSPQMTFSIAFAYQVAPEMRDEFESVYGPDGTWARFFGTDEHYAGTTLEPVGDGEYLVTDRWSSQADYETFLERNAARYEALARGRPAVRERAPAGTYLSSRESRRSLRTRPSVWSCGQ